MTTANTTATVRPTTVAELDLAPIDNILERSLIVETSGNKLSSTELKDFAREIDSALATILPTLSYERVRQPLETSRAILQEVIEPNRKSHSVRVLLVTIARSELKRIVQSIKG